MSSEEKVKTYKCLDCETEYSEDEIDCKDNKKIFKYVDPCSFCI